MYKFLKITSLLGIADVLFGMLVSSDAPGGDDIGGVGYVFSLLLGQSPTAVVIGVVISMVLRLSILIFVVAYIARKFKRKKSPDKQEGSK